MHPILIEQLVADRHRELERTAAQVRLRRAGPLHTGHGAPTTRWRSLLRRAPAADPAPPPIPAVDLAALGAPRLRHLAVVAERVTRAATAVDPHATSPDAAA